MASDLYPLEILENMASIHDAARIPVKSTDRKPGPYPYYGASGVTDHVHDYLFDGDYVLLAEDGDNLRSRNTPIAFMARGRFWVNNHAHILQGKSGNDTNFICYALQIADVSSYISGSTRPKITQKDMRKIPIFCPPKSEQKSITHIIRTLDDKIELNRQMNATLESMAQALFKSWFVDFDPVIDNALEAGNPIPEPLQARAEVRNALGEQLKPLPVHIQSQFPNSFVFSEEMGWLPEGWAIKPLRELTTKIGSGATPRGGKEVYQQDGISLIRSQNVYDSEFTWNGLAYISDKAATQLKGVTVHEEDVLLNITGASILRTCVVDPKALPARVNQHVAIIRAKNGIPSRYLHLHMLQERTKAYLMGQNAGGSREAVTKGHIESVPTLCPTESILEHFKNISASLFAKKDALAFSAKTLSSVRDTLLPKLLSGKLRIPDVEKQLAEAI